MKKSIVMWILMVLVAIWIVVLPKLNIHKGFEVDIEVDIEETISFNPGPLY